MSRNKNATKSKIYPARSAPSLAAALRRPGCPARSVHPTHPLATSVLRPPSRSRMWICRSAKSRRICRLSCTTKLQMSLTNNPMPLVAVSQAGESSSDCSGKASERRQSVCNLLTECCETNRQNRSRGYRVDSKLSNARRRGQISLITATTKTSSTRCSC